MAQVTDTSAIQRLIGRARRRIRSQWALEGATTATVVACQNTIVARNINAAAVKERADVAKLNAGLQQELAGKGLVFNQPNTAPFRDKLRAAGFYSEWKAKYGDQAWSLLEKAAGKLS